MACLKLSLTLNDILCFLPFVYSLYLLHSCIFNWLYLMLLDLFVETEILDQLAELSKVTRSNLDSKKHWYVVMKALCKIKQVAFAESKIFS